MQTTLEAAHQLDQSANSSRFAVELQSPGFLVVSEQYFPGWKAYVDGQSAPIYAANLAMRAVFLEAGEHIVEFVYHPASFYGGLIISMVTLFSVMVISWRSSVSKSSKLLADL